MSDFFTIFLRIVYFLVVFGLIIFFAYFVSRILGKKARYNSSKYMKIIDVLHIGSDRMLAIVLVGNEYLLVSTTSREVRLIKTLDDFVEKEIFEGVEPSGFTYYLERYGWPCKRGIDKMKGIKKTFSNRDGLDE